MIYNHFVLPFYIYYSLIPPEYPTSFGKEQGQKFCVKCQPENLPPQDSLYIASLTVLGECKENDNCQPRQDPNCSYYRPNS